VASPLVGPLARLPGKCAGGARAAEAGDGTPSARRVPRPPDPVIQGINALRGPAGAGLGFRDDSEYPGVTYDVARRRHAAFRVFVDPMIYFAACHCGATRESLVVSEQLKMVGCAVS